MNRRTMKVSFDCSAMVVNRVGGATIDGEALPQSDRGQRILGAIGRRDAGSGMNPLHGLAK
jgi:hypothetical protein